MTISARKLAANRTNSLKCTGAKTARGKAIASRNATKHGLLSQKPPLLLSEDLETFQGLVQSLVDHYQPTNPIEWHLVQTLAMCVQRQYRLWSAEAAMFNVQQVRDPQPPEPPEPPELVRNQTAIELHFNHPQSLTIERELLQHIIKTFVNPRWLTVPTGDRVENYGDCLRYEFNKILVNYPQTGYPQLPDPRFKLIGIDSDRAEHIFSWHDDCLRHQNPALWSIQFMLSVLRNVHDPEALTNHLKSTCDACQQRLEEIDRRLTEYHQQQQEYEHQLSAKQQLVAMGLPPRLDLLARYELIITRQLYEVMDRLDGICAQRHQ